MPRSGPITLSLPPFTGATRRLIVINLAIFFAIAVLGLFPGGIAGHLVSLFALSPYAVFHGYLWQLLTYAFLPTGILSTLFAMLSLWFFGSALEDRFGGRWLMEFYLIASAAGALLACVLTQLPFLRLDPLLSVAAGAWAPVLAILIVYGVVEGDQQLRFNFIITLKAKYLAALYTLYFLAVFLLGPGDTARFDALTTLTAALAGYLYVRFAPRRGVAAGLSEQYFGLRNEFYRNKRRRAARKFEVYMGKQGREVHFDKEGRYVDPESGQAANKDPNDKRWMN